MDFEAVIRAALKDGNSMEDIASAVGATMNKIQAEQKKVDGKKRCLEEWKEVFDNHYKNNDLTMSDVASLAVIISANDHPEWTLADLMPLQQSMKESLLTLTDINGKEFREALSSLMHNVFGPINRKENGKCGGCAKSAIDNAEKRIKDFLDSL